MSNGEKVDNIILIYFLISLLNNNTQFVSATSWPMGSWVNDYFRILFRNEFVDTFLQFKFCRIVLINVYINCIQLNFFENRYKNNLKNVLIRVVNKYVHNHQRFLL